MEAEAGAEVVADGRALAPLVLAGLHAARRSGAACDVRLLAGAGAAPAHAALLCALSPELARLCARRSFSRRRPLRLPAGRCFPCLEALLGLLYCQPVPLPRAHAPHLRQLARRLRLPDLLLDLLPESAPQPAPAPAPPRPPPTLKRLVGKKQACLGCRDRFCKPSDLLKHLRETDHGDDVCSLCLQRCETRADLVRHYALHDNPKPFFCTVCDARFQTRGLLIQHLPRHSEETPYTCTLCKKGFKWKHGLNSHLMIHSNEKKHLCDECGFSTVHAKTLRAHKLTHTGDLFRCSFPGCAHTCSRKENMKIHQLTHSNDKPFVCEICGQKFSLNKSLKRHSLLHGEAVHSNACPHCPFEAIRADNLKAHILRQHTEKPMTLELDENFDEIVIDADDSPNDEGVRRSTFVETDLSVLADAASSRAKMRDPADSPTERFDLACSRNFDNLISNPETSGSRATLAENVSD